MRANPPLEKLSKGERTAQRIMDVAEELFALRGFTATTLRDIAEAARIREPGLYNHFKSKDDLYKHVLQRGLQPLADSMSKLSSETAHVEDLQRLPATILHLLAAHPYMAALLQQALIPQASSKSHTMLETWLNDLVQSGRHMLTVLGQDKLSDEEIALRIITMFNVTTGYFTSAPLFKQLTQGNILDEKNLALQEKILMQIATGFLSN